MLRSSSSRTEWYAFTKLLTGSEQFDQLGGLSITCSARMKILAGLIRSRMRADADKWGHCAIYERELQRLWPIDEKNRKGKIEQFAKEHGFQLSYYKRGFCAIFEKDSPRSKD